VNESLTLWNHLDTVTVSASSVNSFKNHLEVRTSSQGWIFYKTSTICVILEAEPVSLVRPHPVRYPVRYAKLYGADNNNGASKTWAVSS